MILIKNMYIYKRKREEDEGVIYSIVSHRPTLCQGLEKTDNALSFSHILMQWVHKNTWRDPIGEPSLAHSFR